MNNNPFSLENKTILVTGASSGIGYETCISIHKQGGNFIAIARREDLLIELLSKTSNTNRYIVGDLTKENDLQIIIDSLDKIDGLVHCAGIVSLAPVKYYNPKLMEDIRALNYDSILNLVNLLFKKKKVNKESSIVLVASISGLFGMKGNGIYAGTKGALIAISKVWANEFAGMKIRVNCISPGMVRTEITKRSITDLSKEVIEEDEKKYPLGYGDPEDVSNPIVFLLSKGSKWITGQNIVLDGGRTTAI
jgi:NAD(P)-dependent dehydrogenase (short-subunit alcohol dehydrogenase family)